MSLNTGKSAGRAHGRGSNLDERLQDSDLDGGIRRASLTNPHQRACLSIPRLDEKNCQKKLPARRQGREVPITAAILIAVMAARSEASSAARRSLARSSIKRLISAIRRFSSTASASN